jgi:1,6-anhydro-N-acetylmuramate kinase
MRRVIDVSGDGPNNQGRPVLAARADAIAKNVTVNGLPIMLKDAGYFDIQDLDLYYRDCVIGGQGAFMVPARDKAQFRDAVKTKIIMEIASAPSPGRAASRDGGSLVVLAQAAPRANCLAGEQQWRDRMGN